MVTGFSGIYLLSYEFVVIGREVPTTRGNFWVFEPNVVHVATGGKKWLKELKSERLYKLDSCR